MSWVVIAKEPNGTKHRIACETAAQVADQFVEQRRLGRTVTVEEAGGKEVSAAEFGIKGDTA
ncbi:hypothetical protein [Kumtagia ephedrae]|uniref:hypothetical protein n=1 Tax=Kumtagia ephedrae TaxID=2116701 RepID=UPI0010573B0C|nr:hypothetical protein [Mesorhizobium ephedrae]